MDSKAPVPSDSSQEPVSSGTLADLKSQLERLQQLVHELEKERVRDAEALQAAQDQLKEYEQLVYAWARTQVREEDWKDFSEGDYTIPAEEIIAELEVQEG
jgi:hypothetical protein